MKKEILLILSPLLLFGCMTTNKMQPLQLKPQIHYEGFILDRPIYNNWYMLKNEQRTRQAMLRREHTSSHSAYFAVYLDTIYTLGGFDEYAKYIYQRFCINDSVRFFLLENTLEKIPSDSIETYQYYTKTLDKGSYNVPSKPLILETYGFIKKHPSLNNKVLTIVFSERGTEEDFKEAYAKESKFFFNSVHFKK